MNPFRLPTKDVADLTDYQEDRGAMKRYERKFAPLSILGLLLFVGSMVGLIYLDKPWWSLPLFGVAFGLILLNMVIMFFATPRSENGRPLQKYWNSSSSAPGHEVLYVCEETKTYFRRAWIVVTRS